MMDLGSLVENINEGLRGIDEEYALARRSMGIRPDLEEAVKHAKLVDELINAVAVLILEAQNRHGVQQPPDVIRRINARQLELNDLAAEIRATRALVEAGNAKPRIVTGRTGAN